MNIIHSPANVRQIVATLYGPPGWTAALDAAVRILATEPGICQSEVPGRLAALAQAGQDREALLAVALAFGVGPEAPRKEVLPLPTPGPTTPERPAGPVG